MSYLPLEVQDIPDDDAMTVYSNGVVFQLAGDKFELTWLNIYNLVKENMK